MATQADTAPGTVTVSHPSAGMDSRPAKRSGVQAAGARPDPFRPLSLPVFHSSAKASDPRPFMTGSTTVRAAAQATMASAALPPSCSMRSPAWVARG